jgi:hypothetical protein
MNTSYICWLSCSAQVHCLSWALLATSCRVIFQSMTYFSKKGFIFLTVCFLRTMHCPTLVAILLVKTVKHRVTKTHMHCAIILWICQGLVFGVQCLENELWDHFSLERQLLRKVTETTWLNSLLCWNGMNGTAGFSKMGRPPYCENRKSCLAGLLR